jgi:Spy/CpxP family protein refolding chaperone
MRNGSKRALGGFAAFFVAAPLAFGAWAVPSQAPDAAHPAAEQPQDEPGRRLGRPGRRTGSGASRRGSRSAGKSDVERRGRGSLIARALQGADLSPEQRRAMAEIRDRHDARMRGLGRKLIEQRRVLVDALEEPVPNVAGARAVLNDLSATTAEQIAARTEVELELFRILTPEQRSRVRAMRDAHVGARGGPPVDEPPEERPEVEEEDPLAGAEHEDAPAARRRGAARATRSLFALDLAPEQRQRLRELRRQLVPAMRSAGAKIRGTRRALGEALLADALDAERVRALGAELGRGEAERTKLRFEAEAGILSILTPEQTRRYRELRRARREGAAGARRGARGLDTP